MSKKAHHSVHSAVSRECTTDQDGLGLERLIFFSDGVFAIAIILLALDLRLPGSAESPSNAQLLAQLLDIWPKYLAYAVSFLAIGTFWVGDHRRFRLIRHCDRGLLTLNFLFLMVIAFVPFPTSVISETGNRTATIFYALTMALGGLMLATLWWYASWHNRLTDPRLGAQQARREFVPMLLTVGLFVLSIGLAFLDENLARFSWLLVVPISRFGYRG
jgi:uncharacterized membrane protein